jgi:hypothetical protein
MASRLDFHALLVSILGSDNVYFQPPPSHVMLYPCIVYNRSNIRSTHADDLPYKHDNQYTVTVIDANPDSVIPVEVSKIPRSVFDRHFVSENLNHDVFNILF